MNMLEVSALKPGLIVYYPGIALAVSVLKVNRNLEELTVRIDDTREEFVISFDEGCKLDEECDVTMYQLIYNS